MAIPLKTPGATGALVLYFPYPLPQSGEIGIMYRQHGGNISAPERIYLLKISDTSKHYRRDAAKALRIGLVSRALHRQILWRIWKCQALHTFRQFKHLVKCELVKLGISVGR
jgi:hypothetical protein